MAKKNDEIKEEIKIEGVNEIPENAEVVEEVKIETPNDEVTEEIVQAVAQGIVEEAEEQGKTVENIVDEIVKEAKDYSGDLRGFKTLEDAVNYPNTDEFKRLDIGCRTEYSSWLKSILEEE